MMMSIETGSGGEGARTCLPSCVQTQHKETHLLVAEDLACSHTQNDDDEKWKRRAIPNAFERLAPMVSDVDGGGGEGKGCGQRQAT